MLWATREMMVFRRWRRILLCGTSCITTWQALGFPYRKKQTDSSSVRRKKNSLNFEILPGPTNISIHYVVKVREDFAKAKFVNSKFNHYNQRSIKRMINQNWPDRFNGFEIHHALLLLLTTVHNGFSFQEIIFSWCIGERGPQGKLTYCSQKENGSLLTLT